MRATVLFSGGIDSASCACLLQEQGYEVSALLIDFGQPAALQERAAARVITDRIGIPLQITKVCGGKEFASGEIVGRNAFLIFTGLLFASARPSLIALGLHSGTSYYDCSSSFFDQMQKVVQESTDGQVSLAAPFLNWEKADVYSYFVKTKIPASETYSCEVGGNPPCQACASCRDRARLYVR